MYNPATRIRRMSPFGDPFRDIATALDDIPARPRRGMAATLWSAAFTLV